MTCLRLKSGVSLSSHCKRRNINYRMCYNRIEKGMTPDEAVEAVKKWKGFKATLNNCRHFLSSGESLRSACIRESLDRGLCYDLIKDKGLSPDEAFKAVKERTLQHKSFRKFIEEKGLPLTLTQRNLDILKVLKDLDRPVYVSEIRSVLGLSKGSNVCHSLEKLYKAGLIDYRFEKKGHLKKAVAVIKQKTVELLKDG